MPMSNYYTQLGIGVEATHAEIQSAYERQRERYDPERVARTDAEIQRVAAERTAELERIYRILVDPQRRRQYDASIGIVRPAAAAQPQRGLTSRERWYAVGGGLAALLLIAAIWALTGRNETLAGTPMGEVNRPAPAITLPGLDGGTVNLSDYRGQVVLVNFWGTWCEPCRRELPAMQEAYVQLRDQGFMIIGVNLAEGESSRGNSAADIRAFLDQYGVTFPIALDMEGTVANDYRVLPLPTSFFINAQGQIRYVRVGELTTDDIMTRFKQLKQEATAQREE